MANQVVSHTLGCAAIVALSYRSCLVASASAFVSLGKSSPVKLDKSFVELGIALQDFVFILIDFLELPGEVR